METEKMKILQNFYRIVNCKLRKKSNRSFTANLIPHTHTYEHTTRFERAQKENLGRRAGCSVEMVTGQCCHLMLFFNYNNYNPR